jgi:bifunctional non-homologous end joining protein LigD
MAVPRAKPTQSSARRLRRARRASAAEELIPRGENQLEVNIDGRKVRLTNLNKPFWPDLGITKGDLLRYYFEISPYLLPHLVGRAMVLKRYPNGAFGDFFFQKRAPEPRPDWIEICSIQHTAGPVHFAVVRDLASLLWGVNLGAIDLNPWYARCDDTMRPDYLHFDLDPVEGENFERVCETAEVVHEALGALKIPNYAKTTGSRGIHVYVPIVRGPVQKEVWTFAKALAQQLEKMRPELITAEYRIANRPKGHVLVDYNQNAWGRTLASVYSVRPKPHAPVSTPVTWEEIRRGVRIEDFRLDNVPARVKNLGDLWKPLLKERGRFDLKKVMNNVV